MSAAVTAWSSKHFPLPLHTLTPRASLKAMWSPHCISSKWEEPNYSYHAAQGVTEVLYTECYSLHFCDLYLTFFYLITIVTIVRDQLFSIYNSVKYDNKLIHKVQSCRKHIAAVVITFSVSFVILQNLKSLKNFV